MTVVWEKLGRILEPDTNINWLYSSAGASCALPSSDGDGIFDIYVTGRDKQRRSRIGLVKFDVSNLKVLDVSANPVFDLGGKGAFDENGVSYPYVTMIKGRFFMYYAGWVQGVQVPWMNGLGLATSSGDGIFERYSRAPILHRDNEDYVGIGSCCVLDDEGKFKMWYSRYQSWGEGEDEHRHYYNIKYAESEDGVNWVRRNKICIDFKDSSEYAIAKPCVRKIKNRYVMWYSYRGSSYRIGFAISENGIDWIRRDELAGIEASREGWDSQMICYSYVFQFREYLYMLHNGNGYGDSGLGLARIEMAKILDAI
jgi:hypothetical protein